MRCEVEERGENEERWRAHGGSRAIKLSRNNVVLIHVSNSAEASSSCALSRQHICAFVCCSASLPPSAATR